jgi:hypothetical protein
VSIEFFGAALLAVGLATRFAAVSMLILAMVVQLNYVVLDSNLFQAALFGWFVVRRRCTVARPSPGSRTRRQCVTTCSRRRTCACPVHASGRAGLPPAHQSLGGGAIVLTDLPSQCRPARTPGFHLPPLGISPRLSR